MSQVVKSICAKETGERRHLLRKTTPLFDDVFSVETHIVERPPIGMVYNIGVTLRASCVITEEERADNSRAIEMAINRTKQQVIEGIFGEFRPYFRRIEKAIYSYDYDKAGELLYEMERVMFEPE